MASECRTFHDPCTGLIYAKISVRQYWRPELCSEGPNSFTLICAHAERYQDEQWGPTLQRLFDMVSVDRRIRLREAWVIKAPNHVDFAILNESECTGIIPPFGIAVSPRCYLLAVLTVD